MEQLDVVCHVTSGNMTSLVTEGLNMALCCKVLQLPDEHTDDKYGGKSYMTSVKKH